MMRNFVRLLFSILFLIVIVVASLGGVPIILTVIPAGISENIDPDRIGFLVLVLAAGGFLFINENLRDNFIKIVKRTSRLFLVGSTSERLEEEDTSRVLELRRRLDREADADVAERLRQEVSEIERQLMATSRSSLWSQDGTLDLDWMGVFAAARLRLEDETERLKARSRANLRWGIITALLGGIAIMIIIFWPIEKTTDNWELLAEYGPRLALILVIELTSTFFFRMYVSNESDIKQNKNEITNLELRLAAGLLVGDDQKAKSDIAKSLVKEERNFILKKGEKTSVEAWRTEVSDIKSLLTETLAKIKLTKGT
jgi:hypothetical protein